MTAEAEQTLKLLDFIDAATLQHIQDGFAAVTGMAVSFRDPHGQPMIPPVRPNEFCRLIASTNAGRQACADSKRAAAEIFERADQPCRYTCHAGLMQYAAPIIVDGRRLGTIVIGDRPVAPLDSPRLEAIAQRCGLEPKALQAAARALLPWSDSQMAAAARFAHLLANTIARLCYQEHQLRLRVDELSALYQVAGLLAGTGDLQEVLDHIVTSVRALMKAKACSIRLLDQQSGELTIKAVCNLSQEYLAKGPVTVSENPIDAEAISGKVVYVEDSRTDPRVRYPAQARKEGIVSALVAGMIYRGRPVGVMRIYTGQRYRFSAFERSLLQALASQAAAAIVNAQLHAEALEAERYQRQIQYAGQVQRRMIPARAPAHHRLQIGCVYDPMMELGGDFYDFLELGQGDLGLVIADVVGKGVAASLMMASVRSALRTAAQEIYDLDKVMARANRQLCHDTLISEFATVFYGVINPDATRLTYCNAGHDPPLLLRDGQFQSLETGGMVIGVRPDERYEKGVVHLRPGDLLVLYTDGLVEATNFQHQWFGRQNLRRSILRYRQLDAQELAQQLLWDVRRFVGLADRIDDITLVAVKVRG